jgi:uncharacterized secreted protein with C-terminal beta-propeller domain
MNTQNDAQDVQKSVYMMGYSENLFVSQNNIYVTHTKTLPYTYYTERLVEQVIVPLLPADIAIGVRNELKADKPSYERMQSIQEILAEYFNKLSDSERAEFEKAVQQRMEQYYEELARETQKTVVHKIAVSNGNFEYKSRGEVPGTVLNQFSMDEYNDNFRIATTVTSDFRSGATLNNVYVLDPSMSIIGKLENLARTERIYSARFIGDRLYLVTFRQIDPLFVIDLSNPTNPKVLGELKIPGVSQYLHPYDENHIIGVGKDAIGIDEGGREFALFQGVKMSLFDVSDVASPKEVSTVNFGNRGTESEVLYDHKAFLFSKERNLIVLPVTLYVTTPTPPTPDLSSAYGEYDSSSAFVIELTLENGFVIKGSVVHHEKDDKEPYYYYGPPVRRSMYIDNVLYTLSDGLLKMNDLDTLKEINEVIKRREKKYLKIADVVIDTTGISPKKTAGLIMTFLKTTKVKQ